jgi:carbonic anhydrase
MKIRIAVRGVFVAGLCLAVFNCAWAAGEKGEAHWGYEGAEGPDNWGKSFPQCGIGKSQSPIDITGPYKNVSDPIAVSYKESSLKIVNNGHTIQVNYDPGSSMQIGKQRYELLQFHFHRPSEEKLSGKAKPMVAHFVHKSKEGKLAVIGVLMDEGKDNPLISTLWAYLPKETGKENVVQKARINATAFLPSGLGYYHFMGSLTTPPCSEGVAFYILKNTTQVSKAQIEAFPYKMNARPVQALNGRQVAESGK